MLEVHDKYLISKYLGIDMYRRSRASYWAAINAGDTGVLNRGELIGEVFRAKTTWPCPIATIR